MGQVEDLQKENKELVAENQRLISAQHNFLVSKIQELYSNLSVQLEGMSSLIYQQITTDGESTREIMSSIGQKTGDNISEVYMAVTELAKMEEKAQSEVKAAFSSEAAQLKEAEEHLERIITVEGNASREALAQMNTQIIDRLTFATDNYKKEIDSVILSISEMEKSSSSQSKNIGEQIAQSFHNIIEHQQQLASDSCELIANANRDLVSQVEQYSISALKEVKDTADKYRQMEHDEQESLNKIQTFFNEMHELSEHQKKVMERLSQLCQDSDQFMEIQKSINDMWEIMKAVWVDSLLNDFSNNLNGNIEK